WLNSSCYQDYLLIIFNRSLFALLGIGWFVMTIGISLQVLHFLQLFGNAAEPNSVASSWGILFSYTVILFLLDDSSRFLLHKTMHKYDFLWRLHQLHHSASQLTPLTSMRLHPLESLLYQLRATLIHGVGAGCSFYFLGFQTDSFQIWGATVWVIAFNALGANLRHSHIKIDYGVFEKLLISPAQHQAHHGVKSMNRNYGAILSIWDRMAGTWRSGKKSYALPQAAQSLSKQLLLQKIEWK
ncbi:MAG: sterol desaturase family protein, partial [Colwellia sp.]